MLDHLWDTTSFILVDTYTRWPEIYQVKNITADTITTCRKIFSTFGIPKTLVSDNGTQFTSFQFERFLKENGIYHKFSAPYHPATNSMVERYVQTFKQALRALRGDVNLVPNSYYITEKLHIQLQELVRQKEC